MDEGVQQFWSENLVSVDDLDELLHPEIGEGLAQDLRGVDLGEVNQNSKRNRVLVGEVGEHPGEKLFVSALFLEFPVEAEFQDKLLDCPFILLPKIWSQEEEIEDVSPPISIVDHPHHYAAIDFLLAEELQQVLEKLAEFQVFLGLLFEHDYVVARIEVLSDPQQHFDWIYDSPLFFLLQEGLSLLVQNLLHPFLPHLHFIALHQLLQIFHFIIIFVQQKVWAAPPSFPAKRLACDSSPSLILRKNCQFNSVLKGFFVSPLLGTATELSSLLKTRQFHVFRSEEAGLVRGKRARNFSGSI